MSKEQEVVIARFILDGGFEDMFAYLVPHDQVRKTREIINNVAEKWVVENKNTDLDVSIEKVLSQQKIAFTPVASSELLFHIHDCDEFSCECCGECAAEEDF